MLEYHLQNLLYEKECIVIPGFGAIITNHKPASVVESSQRIDPPSKTLAFNESLQTNDGMLADQLARTENMNYAQALETIRQEVKQWHKQLKAGKPLTLEGIGNFRKNENGKLVFKPSRERNYLLEAYGLESVPISPVNRMVQQPSSDSGKIKQLKRTRRNKTPVTSMIAAAGLAFAIFVVSLVMYKNPAPSTIKGDLNPMPYDSQQNTVEQPSATPEQADHNANEPKETASPKEKKQEEKPGKQHNEPASRYFIITGSFQDPGNAEAYKNRWESMGYNSELITNKEGWYRVGIDSYQDSLQAARALHQIKQTEKPSAWLLKLNSQIQ